MQGAHNLKDSLMGAHTPDVSMKAGDTAVVAMEEFLAWPIDTERGHSFMRKTNPRSRATISS